MQWSKRDGRLPYTATQTNGVLVISRAKAEDTGIYVCTVTSSSGTTQETQARVTILAHRGPPTVRIEPEDQTIGQGSTATLRCIAAGDPAPNITWSKVGEELNSPNVAVTGNTLTIRNAAVTDRGMYICTGVNPGGSARASAVVEVERREPPSIENLFEGKLGGNAELQCYVVGNVGNVATRWRRKDGRPLPPRHSQRGNLLYLVDMDRNDATTYTCEGTDGSGRSIFQADTTVTVTGNFLLTFTEY